MQRAALCAVGKCAVLVAVYRLVAASSSEQQQQLSVYITVQERISRRICATGHTADLDTHNSHSSRKQSKAARARSSDRKASPRTRPTFSVALSLSLRASVCAFGTDWQQL